jgi:hypothetical protein
MDNYPQDQPPTELELEEQRAGYQPPRADIFHKLQESIWMPGMDRHTAPPSQEDQEPDPESAQQERD